MNNTKTVSINEIAANPNQFTFCHIPKWAKFAVVDSRGCVKRWMRKEAA